MGQVSMDRRSFMKGSLMLGAASVVGASLMGCSTSNEVEPLASSGTNEETEAIGEVSLPTPDETIDCDVVVVGMGVSGTAACTTAAQAGAKVVGIDRAIGVAATNIVNTVAIRANSAAGTGKEVGEAVRDDFREMAKTTWYELNGPFVSRYLRDIEELVDLWVERGVGMTYVAETPGYYFDVREGERGEQISAMLDSFDNLTQMWRTEVTHLVEEAGVVKGVLAVDKDGKVYQINAAGGVIVGTGGFVHNEEMVAQYMGGLKVQSYANQFNDGAGIKLAQSVGAQMGKNFCMNCAEGGGVNSKSHEFNTYLFGTSGLSRSPIIGDVLLNQRGKRFCDEGVMVDKTAMFCGESLTREGGPYYSVMSQATIDALSGKTILQYVKERYNFDIWHQMVIMFFGQAPLDTIQQDADTAIEEGWCWKADTFEELEQVSGVENLADTMNEYNAMCEAGVDTRLYKAENFLVPYAPEDGPFYLIEHEMPCWATQGGIKTDEDLRALDGDMKVIEGLYVVGMDADLQSSPYMLGATAQGFSAGSGQLAARHAVSRL